jgi:DNA invertase Pin-like site-specific DNA recombinase
MPAQRFVTYARVSTQRQGQLGLSLDAQRHAVTQYLGANMSGVMGEFVEIESGRKTNRPELAKALALCRAYGATLVVSKLDRLARNAAFLLALRDSKVDFICADMPQATRLTIGIMAVIAEAEADAISARTKAALAERKRRGFKLGNPEHLFNEAAMRKGHQVRIANARAAARQRAAALTPIVNELRAGGALTFDALADGLNARGIPAPRGGLWGSAQTWALLRLIDFRPTLPEALRVIREELRHRGGHRERNLRIAEARMGGRTLQSLADEHGLSRERIRQLCYLDQRRRARKKHANHCFHQSPARNVELRTALEELLMEH